MTASIRQACEKADEAWLRETNTYPSTKPKDQWKESLYWYPKKNIVVLAWDGMEIIRCRYDEIKGRWYDETGKGVGIIMWRRV